MADLERIYVIPLRGAYDTPRTRRSRKAVRLLQGFVARHMKVEPGNVRISEGVNKTIWKRGIQKPPRRIKVRVVKSGDIAKAMLMDEKEEAEGKKPEAKKKEKEAGGKKEKAESAPSEKEAKAAPAKEEVKAGKPVPGEGEKPAPKGEAKPVPPQKPGKDEAPGPAKEAGPAGKPVEAPEEKAGESGPAAAGAGGAKEDAPVRDGKE